MLDQALLRQCFSFLWSRREMPVIPEFHHNHPVRDAFHADLVRLAGHSVGKVYGGWAIVRVWLQDGVPSKSRGDWDGIGVYTENLQDVIDHLLPKGVARTMAQEAGGRTIFWVGPSGNGLLGVGPSPARAALLAWLRWLAAENGVALDD